MTTLIKTIKIRQKRLSNLWTNGQKNGIYNIIYPFALFMLRKWAEK